MRPLGLPAPPRGRLEAPPRAPAVGRACCVLAAPWACAETAVWILSMGTVTKLRRPPRVRVRRRPATSGKCSPRLP
eukprot:1756971-Alexandrium_andersonii.AAC.1